VIVPAASFARFSTIAAHLGAALAQAMKQRGLQLGRDVAIVISSDGTHYGADFRFTPDGEGGVASYEKTLARDRALLTGPLAGPVSADKARAFLEAMTNPERLDEYRGAWCGRFSVPFGLLLLAETARGLGLPPPVGVPVAMGNSVGEPELKVRPLGIGPTAPANLYHFVIHPAVAFVRDLR
jgi:hypothetical protein